MILIECLERRHLLSLCSMVSMAYRFGIYKRETDPKRARDGITF